MSSAVGSLQGSMVIGGDVARIQMRKGEVGAARAPKKQLPVWRSFVGGGLGSILGCLMCHPFDVLKVRLQVQGEGMRLAGGNQVGMQGMALRILQTEGLVGGFSYGISSQLLRAINYYTVKIGMYDVIKRQVFNEGPGKSASFPEKVAAGLVAGGIGAACSNPCDVIMVRMLADRAKPPDQRANFPNAFKMFANLSYKEYMVGFVPNVARATIVTASQLVTYDQLKQSLLAHTSIKDSMPLHVVCSVLAGVVTGVTSNPMDVMKTRMMNTSVKYNGLLDCFIATFRNEGIVGFYKGCATTIVRQCALLVGTFVAMEQIKQVFSMMDQALEQRPNSLKKPQLQQHTLTHQVDEER